MEANLRRVRISCHFLHFDQTEDIWLKSALEGKMRGLLITGSTSLFSKKLPIQMPI